MNDDVGANVITFVHVAEDLNCALHKAISYAKDSPLVWAQSLMPKTVL